MKKEMQEISITVRVGSHIDATQLREEMAAAAKRNVASRSSFEVRSFAVKEVVATVK